MDLNPTEMDINIKKSISLVGTSGPAGIKAGIGATHPVSGSVFFTSGDKAGSRKSEVGILTFSFDNLAKGIFTLPM